MDSDTRPKIALHKFSSCDGCQLAFLNLGTGLLSVFGLLVIGVARCRRLLPRLDPRTEAPLFAALMCAVAIRAVDMLPNGLSGPLPFVLSGALLGVADHDPAAALPVGAGRRLVRRVDQLHEQLR